MRLPMNAWRNTLTSMGFRRKKPVAKQTAKCGRVIAFETLQDRAMLSVTSTELTSAQIPAGQMLAAALADVGPATTINLSGGNYQADLAAYNSPLASTLQ